MIERAALGLAAAAGCFLLALGATALLSPPRARRFLLGFAATPARHYAELALRLLVGGAFVLAAPGSAFPRGFSAFGWLLLGTTAVLLLAPWRWHRRFAERSVPAALRFLPLLSGSSLALGGLVLWGVVRGGAT